MPSLSSRGRIEFEPGSYRDRDGRVFRHAGTVYRALSNRALEEWEFVHQTKFFPAAVAAGEIVETQRVDSGESGTLAPGWAAVLKHETIPFVSYPFEWTFGMLQDAALLQLKLLQAALDDDVTLKDGTAYNVQWRGTAPVFIDIASFERLQPGQAWAGYRQFCQTMLFPLLLQAYKRVDFHPWLRGRLDGMTAEECWRVMSFRDFFRRGVPTHVYLHSKFQSSATLDAVDTGKSLRAAGFHKEMIRNNAVRLHELVGSLRWSPSKSTWSGYADANSYSDGDRETKEQFVRGVTRTTRWEQVWDLGCNTGTFSRIAAENADLVVAIDADHLAVERLYQSLKAEGGAPSRRVLPLVSSVVDQTGGLGWLGSERRALRDRGRPNLTLCLALIHHLVIGHGVPVAELLRWLAGFGSDLVVEYVAKDDPMVRRLLRGRTDNYFDYEPEAFERQLAESFIVQRREVLPSRTRVLYHAVSREAA